MNRKELKEYWDAIRAANGLPAKDWRIIWAWLAEARRHGFGVVYTSMCKMAAGTARNLKQARAELKKAEAQLADLEKTASRHYH